MNILYLMLLFLIPIIISVILNPNNEKRNDEFENMEKIVGKITIIIFIIFFVTNVLQGKSDDNSAKLILLNTLYFSMMLSFVVFINYFSTRCINFKNSIKIFLNELLFFWKHNFILNLLLVMLIVFTKKHNNLTVGLIGSYIFFVLTSVHGEYKKKITNNDESKVIYKIVQTILNFCLLWSFTSIEGIIVGFSNGISAKLNYKDIVYAVFLLVMIFINSRLPEIELFFKKIINLKEK